VGGLFGVPPPFPARRQLGAALSRLLAMEALCGGLRRIQIAHSGRDAPRVSPLQATPGASERPAGCFQPEVAPVLSSSRKSQWFDPQSSPDWSDAIGHAIETLANTTVEFPF
jgi:hypothetical protein